MKLKARITALFLLLSVIPLIVMAVIVCKYGQDFLRQSFGSSFQYIARHNLEKVKTYVYQFSSNIQTWAGLDFMGDVATSDNNQRIASFLKQLKKEYHSVDGFEVLNTNGEVVASSSPEMYGRKFTQEEFFSKAIDKELYISDAQWDKSEKQGFIILAAPIRTRNNNSIDGVLRARLNIKALSNAFKDASQKNKYGIVHLLLIRKDGLVIGGTEIIAQGLLAVNLSEMKLKAVLAVQKGNEGYLIEEETLGGTKYLIGYSTAQDFQPLNELDWGMLVVQDVREVFSLIDHFRFICIAVVLLLVLGVIFMALKMSHSITTPILNVTSMAAEVAKGNFGLRIHYPHKDEIGSLVKSFNKMTHDLTYYHLHLTNEKNTLEHLLDIDCTMQSIQDMHHLVDFVIHHTTSILGTGRCSLMLLDPNSKELLIRGSAGISEEIIKSSRVKLGEPIAGWVAHKGSPLLINNIEEASPLSRRNNPSYKNKSFMSVPIKTHNKVIGVINVADKESKEESLFTQTDLKILCTIVRQAAIALENADYYRKLEYLSTTDSLTGIFNHRYFLNALDQEIDRAQRYKQPLCLLMLDIDDFKSYNDTYGHLGGDSLLTKLSEILKENLRRVDIVCRYAGDEFAAILPHTTISKAEITADKIRNAIQKNDFERQVTVSIGISGFNSPMNRRDLIMKADQALYQSKRGGKNKISSFY